MATDNSIIVIVGPTASGKSAAAVELAKAIDGEVICADSRTIYKEMDIGTAKPTLHDQQGIAHWGLNLVSPTERYTVAQFQRYAKSKVQQIHTRGKIPIIVGGTGLYVDSFIFDYGFPEPPSLKERQSFKAMSIEQMHAYCDKNNIQLPEVNKNKRHIERLLYADAGSERRQKAPAENIIVVGIATNKKDIEQRIAQRTEQMFADGVVEEANMLGKKYGWDNEAMKGNVYRIMKMYSKGELDIDASKAKNHTLDRQLVKRQMTWFRRNPYILWMRNDEIVKKIVPLVE